MTDNPLISIVVPVYNASKYIGKTIESVLAQTYKEWELLLVNDCSTDNSVEVISAYLSDKRIKLITQDKNMGAAKARNRGIDEANGQVLAYIDADDLWHEDKLKKELAFMKANDVAFCYTEYEFGDENAKGTGKYVRVLDRLTYKKALSRTIIFTSTVMFDLEKISKEDIKMPAVASEDTASWWSILRKGYMAFGLKESLTIYRRPEKSLSSNKFVAIKRIWNLYRNVENLNVLSSLYYFIFWAIRATLRRV